MLLYGGIKNTNCGFQSPYFTIFKQLDTPWKDTLKIESQFCIYIILTIRHFTSVEEALSPFKDEVSAEDHFTKS